MNHRHLNHERMTLAAVDDIIVRGGPADWAELRQAVRADRAMAEKTMRLSQTRRNDPGASRRYAFWMHYAQRLLPGVRGSAAVRGRKAPAKILCAPPSCRWS